MYYYLFIYIKKIDDGTQECKIYIDLKHLDLDEIRIKKIDINQPSITVYFALHDKVIINEIRDDQIKNTVFTPLSAAENELFGASRYGLQIDCRSVDIVQLN